MKIDFMVLCDAAQAANGKLFILGGGWNLYRSGNFPAQMQLALGLCISIPWAEAGSRFPLTISIFDEAAIPIVPDINGFAETGKPEEFKGMEQNMPLAINLNVAIPHPGKYSISARVGSARAQTTFQAIFTGKKVEFIAPETGTTERGN